MLSGMERKRREEPKEARGCHSSIALHPHNFVTDDSGQVLALAPSRLRYQAPAATSADQLHLPLSHERPKLIGKARPATNGIRTSTKYKTKIAKQAWKVNLRKHPKDALAVSIFWRLARIDGERRLG
jgi:hypothetical protein